MITCNYSGTISATVVDGPKGSRYAQTAKKVLGEPFNQGFLGSAPDLGDRYLPVADHPKPLPAAG